MIKAAACFVAVIAIVTSPQVTMTAEEGAENVAEDSRLDVKVGDTRIIMRGSNYPTLFKFADGSLLLTGSRGSIGSTDGGSNWQPCEMVLPVGVDGPLGRLKDGTAMSIGQRTKPVEGTPDTYVGERWLSADNGQTVVGPEPVYVTCPNVTEETVEGTDVLEGPIFHGQIIHLDNGDLLATMYTTFPQDAAKEGDSVKLRSILIKSTDGGVHWDFVSTIASMDTLGSPEARQALRGQEGLCEPTLALLPSGNLVCVVRAGTYVAESGPSDTYHDLTYTVVKDNGKYYTTGPEPCKPLYLAISTDGGETWSTPRPIETATGACPRMTLLSNGVLALSYGRLARPSQGDGIIFSADGGNTWTNEVNIYPGLSGGYTSMVETEPNKILYVFDAVTAWGPKHEPDWIGAVDIEVNLR